MFYGVTAGLLSLEKSFLWQMFMRLATMGLSKGCGIHSRCGSNRWGDRGCVSVGTSTLLNTSRGGDGLSMSRLDRFLLSDEWCLTWPNSKQMARLRGLSDHCPLVLSTNEEDWGPRLSRMLKCWKDVPGYNLFVREKWNTLQ
ncbi:endonuclease/exonuclease/phosphatase family protein, partial [Trifolium medium]|nr:endonuclease/exonuclease/phosphatase family protein [Trifolium medium]